MIRPNRLAARATFCVLALTACHNSPPEPVASPPAESPAAGERFVPDDVRADLDALYAGLREAHYDLFALTTEAAFDAHHAALRGSITEPLDQAAAEVLFQRFVAFADTGHARVELSAAAYAAFRQGGGKVVPFFVRVIDGRTLVAESYTPDLQVGDEVAAIDEIPMAVWLERLGAHVSAETSHLEHALFEFWFPRLMWLELGEVDAIAVGVRRGDAAAADVRVKTRTADEIEAAARRGPERLELSWDDRESRQLGDGVGYLRPGPFYEPEGEDPFDPAVFLDFLDTAFGELIAAGTSALIVDLRDNPGGDNSFSDPMIAWFADRPFRFNSRFRIRVSPQTTASNARRLEAGEATGPSQAFAQLYARHRDGEVVDFELAYAEPRQGERFTGDVYLLVNRHSFSNAVNAAALSQDYGFATILGEETADLATAFGAMEHFELPATGIRVGYPKAFIIRPSGDETLRGVVPDIAIETPLVEGPEDPVLRRAVEIVRQRLR